jgi:hypothetical protein
MAEALPPWPPIPEDLLAYLEDLYPPKCMARDEHVEDHLRYAGATALVEDLRYHFEQQRQETHEARAEAVDEVRGKGLWVQTMPLHGPYDEGGI